MPASLWSMANRQKSSLSKASSHAASILVMVILQRCSEDGLKVSHGLGMTLPQAISWGAFVEAPIATDFTPYAWSDSAVPGCGRPTPAARSREQARVGRQQ